MVGLATGACDRGLLSSGEDDVDAGGLDSGGAPGAGRGISGAGGIATSSTTIRDVSSGSAGSVMMFVPDDLANVLYRYAIAPGADPVLTATLPVPSASSVAMSPKGELFVGITSPPGIYKITSPLSTPTVKGPLSISGISVLMRFDVRTAAFVDDDLLLASPGMSAAWTVTFDTQGNPAISWAVGAQTLPSCAGMAWNPASRVLYVSQLFPSGGTVQAYRIAGDHSQTRLADITGNGLQGPDGMVIAPWGELLVANYDGNTVSRFILDASGSATPNGTITGNGLNNPTSVAMAPWGELFVGNQGSGTLSRFTFDASHAAAPNGTFQSSCKANPRGTGSASRMNWIAIPPQAWSSTGAGGSTGTGGSGGSGGSGTGGQSGVDGGTATTGSATLFVPDDLANSLYRYSIAPGAAPSLNATITVPSAASVALRSTDELFVASYSPPGVYKLNAPFGSPVLSGPLSIGGISVLGRFDVTTMAFVDDDLGLVNPGMSSLDLVSFDTQGKPAFTRGFGSAPSCSGVLWNPDARILYLSQRFPSGGTIRVYRIGSDHTPTQLADIAGNGLAGPDGMALTSWGELLVANYYANTVSRFSVDAQGNATANGTIVGNGLSYPTSVAIAPWGELFVGNQGSGTVSRFTFDASHGAVAQGAFQTPCDANAGGTVSTRSRMDWIAILPLPSTGAGY